MIEDAGPDLGDGTAVKEWERTVVCFGLELILRFRFDCCFSTTNRVHSHSLGSL